MLRTHTCGELRIQDVGRTVTLAGWVNRRRYHGALTFVNLRDREGITQVVFDPEAAPDAFQAARQVGSEWVVAIDGVVRPRPEGQANPRMATGEIEVLAHALRVLSPARTPPFEVAREVEVEEGLRLRYRYLDLRRARMQRNLLLRHRVTSFVRRFLEDRGFLEIETPILIKSTPEGARDFLVPSRMHPGKFYALPQSPQQIKQLLMVAGVDRYYQLARCFRDEDQRADRQLEFTQLDLEMAFVDETDVMALNEELFVALVAAVTPGLKIRQQPFPRLTFAAAMDRFGTDQPDLRFGLELVDLSEALKNSHFRVFANAVQSGGKVKAIAVPQLSSRRQIDELEAVVREQGAAGLAWLAFTADGSRGSVARFLSEGEVTAIAELTGAGRGTTVLMVAGPAPTVAESLGRLRVEVAHRLELAPEGELAFVWILDPPLVEWNAEEKRWDPAHHPFTAPREEDLPLLETDPGAVRARAYDLVCNGHELAGGSIRIHQPDVQARVFSLIGLSPEEATAKFGHLLEAFQYGAPPHGGIAWGFDRTVMVLANEASIREVIAFPKTLSGVDPMTRSPAPVPPEDLEALGIALTVPPPDTDGDSPSSADTGADAAPEAPPPPATSPQSDTRSAEAPADG